MQRTLPFHAGAIKISREPARETDRNTSKLRFSNPNPEFGIRESPFEFEIREHGSQHKQGRNEPSRERRWRNSDIYSKRLGARACAGTR